MEARDGQKTGQKRTLGSSRQGTKEQKRQYGVGTPPTIPSLTADLTTQVPLFMKESSEGARVRESDAIYLCVLCATTDHVYGLRITPTQNTEEMDQSFLWFVGRLAPIYRRHEAI